MEIEYKEKSVLLDYFIEIGSEIIKSFRENNIKTDNFVISRSIWDNTNIYDSLYKLTKQIQKKYKDKICIMKERKIFDLTEHKLTRNSFIVYYLDKFRKAP